MKTRTPNPTDLPKLLTLIKAHAAHEKSTFDPTNKLALLHKTLFAPNNITQCLLVEIDTKIVGYATFMKQYSTWDAAYYVYLDCLYLEEETRGQGIGTILMDKIKDYAKAENCQEIQWQTPDFNTKAIKFYKKIGGRSKTKERFCWPV